MVRGISFKVEKKEDRILEEILKGINVLNYDWYNIESQMEAWYFEDDGEEGFLADTYYSGRELLKNISKNHYVIFLKLEAYPKKTNDFDQHTLEEFQSSECKILLLIYDCRYVEIFAKEKNIIDNLYINAQKKGFTKIEYITDVNDGRIKMDVL